jgi:hypothetical protein
MTTQEIKTKYTLNQLFGYLENIPQHLKHITTEEQIKEAIKMKQESFFKSPLFVTMNDKFMSGWGRATGKTNKLIIACDTLEQAEAIERNAKQRNEMKYINICSRKPQIKSHHYPSWKHFEDMGEIWTK